MANYNNVTLIGRLTRDPELKSLPSGSTLAVFGIAVSTFYSDADGNRKEETDFVDCELWGPSANVLGNNAKKGTQLFVTGRLKYDSWEKDGEKRSRLLVKVDRFQFLDAKKIVDESENEAPPTKTFAGKKPQGKPPF